MRKNLKLLLTIVLCLPLTGCTFTKQEGTAFDQYTAKIVPLLMKYHAMDVNFFFEKPETFGIKEETYSLSFMSLDDYKKQVNDMKALEGELTEFDYDALNNDQKITYDLLKENEQDTSNTEADYYLSTNYFDVNSGMQAQLPFSLWNYSFHSKKSVLSFIDIMKDAPKMFKRYVRLEKERQDKGYGMSETYMDDVLSSFHDINTGDQSYIIDSAYAKLDKVSFLSKKEKQSFREQMKNAFETSFLPAFIQTEQDLKTLEIKKQGEGELSSYKAGKAYYVQLLKDSAGFQTIDDYTEYLDLEEKKIMNRLEKLMSEYPKEVEQLFKDPTSLEKIPYTSLTTPQEVLNHLEGIVNEGKDFPKLQPLQYQMNIIPESMQDTVQLAAAYYLSALDNKTGTNEQMILNGHFKSNDFTTIAHEGFPGHMYQHNYFKTIKHNVLRDLLSSSGYVEGWATYVEGKACDFTDNPAACHYEKLNSQLTYLYVLRLDKQIHYDGISREEAYGILSDQFGIADEVSQSAQYEQLLENPAVFVNYYGGLYRILDLQDKAKASWGKSYSDYKFNKKLLDLGPLPFDLLAKYMELN